MEPFLAIGDILAQAGHEVVCVMPEQFRDLVSDTPHQFAPLDRRFMDLIDGEAGRAIMGQKGSVWVRLGAYAQLVRDSLQLQRDIIREQKEYIEQFRPDRVISHPKCIFARIWGMKHPGRAICVSPVPNMTHPVAESSHIGFAKDFGPWGNRLSFSIVNNLTALMAARYTKPYRSCFAGLKLSRSSIFHYLRYQERVLYLVSPSLVSRPNDWPGVAKIMGYYERKKTNHWQPTQALAAFLSKYAKEKISFITFGSMVNDNPHAKTAAIVKVLRDNKIPAILNLSSGGLQELSNVPDHVFFVNTIPYEWIFPKVHNVVHHGGSGTTHTAVKHGCASLIIPHIIDQFYWNRKLASLGLGPLGIKIKRLTAATFSPLILELRNNDDYRKNAERIKVKFAEEARPQVLLEELLKD